MFANKAIRQSAVKAASFLASFYRSGRAARRRSGAPEASGPLLVIDGVTQRNLYKVGCGLLTALALALGGCSTAGDLGRPKRSFVIDEVTRNYDKVRAVISPNHSKFVLSREETEVRQASYHFHQPLPSPLVPMKIVNMIRTGSLGSLSDYAESLTSRGYADGNARAGEIDELLAADQLWLKRFSRAGRMVRASDRERLIVLEEDPGAFSDDDRINAHARIKENATIMLSVLTDVDQRLTAYDYAIQRTRLEWPRTSLTRTETSLNLLREKAGRLRVELGFDGTGLDFEEVEIIEPVVTQRYLKPRPAKMRVGRKGKLTMDPPYIESNQRIKSKANIMPGFEDPS